MILNNLKITAAMVVLVAAGWGISVPQASSSNDGLFATITTNRGDIKIKFYFDRTPLTVCNFVGLAEGKLNNTAHPLGTPFFDGQKWYRVVADWVIQSGSPTGNTSGGPGYYFRCEPDTPYLMHDKPGVVGMANTGAGTVTNGSQFYITHTTGPQYDRLNGGYTIFGQVVDTGMKTVMRIVQGDQLTKVTITRVGAAATAFTADQKMFDSLLAHPTNVAEGVPDPHSIAQSMIAGVSGGLKVTGTGSAVCKVFTTDGRMIYSAPLVFDNGSVILRITGASGLHVVQVHTDRSVVRRKVILP